MSFYQKKSADELKRLRESGKRLSAVLATVAAVVAPGVSTEDLDRQGLWRRMGKAVSGFTLYLDQ